MKDKKFKIESLVSDFVNDAFAPMTRVSLEDAIEGTYEAAQSMYNVKRDLLKFNNPADRPLARKLDNLRWDSLEMIGWIKQQPPTVDTMKQVAEKMSGFNKRSQDINKDLQVVYRREIDKL